MIVIFCGFDDEKSLERALDELQFSASGGPSPAGALARAIPDMYIATAIRPQNR